MQTPFYLLDERRLRRNLEIIRRVRRDAGARCLLALKCFASWSVFGLLRQYLDGATSSGLYEARLGREKFGGEIHAYSVGFTRAEVRAARRYADKFIFNSLSQLRAFHREARGLEIGLRVNPGFSYSQYDLADPARRYCRLGVCDRRALLAAAGEFSGVMFHCNCENGDCAAFARELDRLEREFSPLLQRLSWVSLGGGLAFTRPGYPLAAFCARLREFSRRWGVQVYLEPGDAAVSGGAELVTTVLDVVRNEMSIAIVDASLEAHLLDHLVYRTRPRISFPGPGRFPVMIAGRSCLAGDVFGRYRLAKRLRAGDRVRVADAASYSLVKKNWFNGLPMPAIVVRRLNGRLDTVRTFGYKDYLAALS